MARIAFVSDVHVGNHRRFGGPVESGLNRRCTQIVESLYRATAFANEEQADAFVVCGDLFDTSHPEPQVISAVQGALAELECDAFLLVGNHDQVSTDDGDHALGPLHDTRVGVRVIEYADAYTIGDARIFFAPFAPRRAIDVVAQALKNVEDASTDMPTALVLHAGIADGNTPPYLRGAMDALPADVLDKLLRAHGIDVAFAGNWHKPQTWEDDDCKTRIVQCGALVPTGWDNPGEDYGRVWLWDSNSGEIRHARVAGPRFLSVHFRAPGAIASLPKDTNVYLSIVASPDDAAMALSTLHALQEEGKIVDGEIKVERGEIVAAAQVAARRARSASTLDEALSKYVKAMHVDEGVDREAVLATARKYLASGGVS